MLKNNISSICILIGMGFASAQTINLPPYDGSPTYYYTNELSVNDNLVITFQDKNVTPNFYTKGFTELYLYGGLETDSGETIGMPDITNTAAMPVFSLVDTDSDVNQSPNVYRLSINLASWYSGVPDGTTVTKFNFRIRNSQGYTGEDITLSFSIDLKDANKDSTLSVEKSGMVQSLKVVKNQLIFTNYSGKISIKAYDILGHLLDFYDGLVTSSKMSVFMAIPNNQLTLLKIDNDNVLQTVKTINH